MAQTVGVDSHFLTVPTGVVRSLCCAGTLFWLVFVCLWLPESFRSPGVESGAGGLTICRLPALLRMPGTCCRPLVERGCLFLYIHINISYCS